jgi:acyl carrier protein
MTIREHIADILNVPLYEALDWTTWAELGQDSLDVMDMMHKLEDRLGIRFPHEKYNAVGDVVRKAQTLMEESEVCTQS